MKQYNPELYYNLELNIMSCLLQRPELMQKCTLEDKHFKKYQKLWKFMRIFYSKYKCFDLVLMTSVAYDRHNLIEYLSWLVEMEPAPSRFEQYQAQLINQYEKSEKDKDLIEKIFTFANELYIGRISINKFKGEVDKIYEGRVGKNG